MPGQPASFFTYFPISVVVGAIITFAFIVLVWRTVVQFKTGSFKSVLTLAATMAVSVVLLWYFTLCGVYDSWLPEQFYWPLEVTAVVIFCLTLFVAVFGWTRWESRDATMQRSRGFWNAN